jgi:hypothetical protein
MSKIEQIADSLEGLRASLAGHVIDHRIEYLDDILEGLRATVDALRDYHGDPHPGLTAAKRMKAAADIIAKLSDDDLGCLLAIVGVVPCPAKAERIEQVLILLGGDVHSLRWLESESVGRPKSHGIG